MNKTENRPWISPLMALFFAILAVSASSIFIRYAQEYTSSLVIAALRLSLASLALAPVALLRHRNELRSLTRGELGLSLLSGAFLAVHFATWITSLEYTSVTSSVVLVATTPLWVALLSPILLKEMIPRKILAGMGVALIGGVIVGLSDSCRIDGAILTCLSFADLVTGKAILGNALAVSGAIMAAGYIIVGRSLRSRMSLISYIFIVYGMAALVMVTTVFVVGQSLFGHPPQAYFWSLMQALFPQLIGHSTFNWALRYLSAAYVSTALLGEPIGTSILAYFLLDETPPPMRIIGAILILTGIYVASQIEIRQSPNPGS